MVQRELTKFFFQPLIRKAQDCVKAWNQNSISLAGHTALINSVLMPITTYQLSCVTIPDSVIDQISKRARNFLWGGSCNCSGFHTMGWSTTTLPETDGGVGVRNLRNAKIALMSKNVFLLLNAEERIWAHIFKLKYGGFHSWHSKASRIFTCFTQNLYSTASKIKSNYWIKECNPSQTDFLSDPWFFNIPIAAKPTLINMSLQLEGIFVKDCVINNSVNFEVCSLIFGDKFDWSLMNNLHINRDNSNY